MFDRRSSVNAPVGYVNTFKNGPGTWLGRVYYYPPLPVLEAAKPLRFGAVRRFEACWPVCLNPSACGRWVSCARDAQRALRIMRARNCVRGLV